MAPTRKVESALDSSDPILSQCVSRLISLKRAHSSNPTENSQAPIVARRTIDRIVNQKLLENGIPVDIASKLLMCISHFQLLSSYENIIQKTIRSISAQTYDMTPEGIFPYVSTLASINTPYSFEALEKVGPRLIHLVVNLTSVELSNTIVSYVKFAKNSEKVIDALLIGFINILPLSTLADCARVLGSIENLPTTIHYAKDVCKRAYDILLEYWLSKNLELIRSRDVIILIRVAAKHQYHDRKLYDLSCRILLSKNEISPHDSIGTIAALKGANFINLAYVKSFTKVVVHGIQITSLRYTCQLSNLLYQLGVTSTAIHDTLRSRIKGLLNQASPTDLVHVIYGFHHETQNCVIVDRAVKLIEPLLDRLTFENCVALLSAISRGYVLRNTPFVRVVIEAAEQKYFEKNKSDISTILTEPIKNIISTHYDAFLSEKFRMVLSTVQVVV